MSNIVLWIIILGKVESLAKLTFSILMIYAVFLFWVAFMICPTDIYDYNDVFNYIKDVTNKFKVKPILVILIISVIISILIPAKEELILYYGSKQITIQNYHMVKDELLGFVKDIKKEINKD